jgi:dTDP-4-amino-4,6-dideoxygalactose transaminase
VPDGAPVSSQMADRILSLPMHPDLTEDQVHYVAQAVRSFDAVPV